MSDYKHDRIFQRATDWNCAKCDCFISEDTDELCSVCFNSVAVDYLASHFPIHATDNIIARIRKSVAFNVVLPSAGCQPVPPTARASDDLCFPVSHRLGRLAYA